MDLEGITQMDRKYLFQNYGRQDLAFSKGEGCYLYGVDGQKYLDLVAGIAVNAIGYSHPKWVAVMQEQVSRLVHVSNLYEVEEQARLAEKISHICPGDIKRSIFVNSGAEANECALKLAVRNNKGRGKIVSALNGFHGRTAASLGATGQTKYQASFEPLISGAFDYFEYGNEESLKFKVDNNTAAVIIEPIQGEGGVVMADPSFYRAVRDVCDDNGAIMIVDEVQTGMGRTGRWFGINNYNVLPDIITMAKGLGGGVPIGACVTTDDLAQAFTPGTHGTTFGGNPLVCASGCAVLDIMQEENLVENACDIGDYMLGRLKGIHSPSVADVRGMGLMIGIEMDSEETAAAIKQTMLENHILINVCHGKVIRLIPPLILNRRQADAFIDLFVTLIK